MGRLDEFLPVYDVRERHERRVDASPADAVAAALATPVAPDALVRARFRLRGLGTGRSVYDAMRSLGLAPLVEEPAVDATARRAFRRHLRAVGPFSGLIRRRWLAAAARALR